MKSILHLLLITTALACAVATDQPLKSPLTLSISAEPAVVKLGSEASIKVTLTNNLSHDIDDSANINDMVGVNPNYLFEVRDRDGNLVPKRQYEHSEFATGHARFGTIKSGQTITDREVVSRLYDMSRPGVYVVQVGRRPNNNVKDPIVKSNKISITVTDK